MNIKNEDEMSLTPANSCGVHEGSLTPSPEVGGAPREALSEHREGCVVEYSRKEPLTTFQ